MRFIKASSSYSSSHLPEQFSNTIYYSENPKWNGFTYNSPFSLKYVISGFETYEVEGQKMLIEPNQHLLVNNDRRVTSLEARGKALSIFIDPTTLTDVQTILSGRSLEKSLDEVSSISESPVFYGAVYQHTNIQTQKKLSELARRMTLGDISGHYVIEPSVFFELSEALIFDQQEHTNRIKQLSSLKMSTVQEQYKRLMQGYEYLCDHWNEPFSLSQTATIAQLSPYHFHRLFKNCFSQTPYQFHLGIQMERAMEFLKRSHHSITEICFQLGFNSPTAFGRAFKKYFDQSPSQVRRSIKK